jgi:hypothetical protein
MKSSNRYHFLTRVLVIASVVAVLPLAAGFLLIQHSAKARLSDASGTTFVSLAEQTASAVDNALEREMEFLTAIARSPLLVRELKERDEDLSPYLTRAVASSSIYREIVVVSELGEVVGAEPAERETARQVAEEEGFQNALARARSERSDSWAEVVEDGARVTLYRVVREPQTGAVLGLVRAKLDAERLFAGITDFRIGASGHACLFDRRSGLLIAGGKADCGAEGTYALLDALGRAQTQGKDYFLAGVAGPASFDRADALLVAHARPELTRSFPELDWVVTVEQSLSEAHAPVAALFRDMILSFLVMGALVVLLGGYLSYKLERPVTDVEIDLHPDLATKQV